MPSVQSYAYGRAPLAAGTPLAATLRYGVTALVVTWAVPARASAHQSAAAASSAVVFDGVTVVDVDQGKLVPDQRVIIKGNRIAAVGNARTTKLPKRAQVVPSQGKYLIPGLWDLHVHPGRETDVAYPLFIANGVTGIRDAGSPVSLETLRLWRREILAGTRVGPPRQVLSGQSITGPVAGCKRQDERWRGRQTCVADAADAVHYVDSLKAAGADMIKPREVDHATYFAIAAAARRAGIPFGGHVSQGNGPTEFEASDSGALIIDHSWGDAGCGLDFVPVPVTALAKALGLPEEQVRAMGMTARSPRPGVKPGDAEFEACQEQAAARFWRNGTWFVPTFAVQDPPYYFTSNVWKRLGFPILAGTDDPDAESEDAEGPRWGTALHRELAKYVAKGMTPLNALRTATLNPAKALHATDSLGTVARGKSADLVLLDADPLADIANTTKIRAVVANGRYYDRAALDGFAVRKAEPKQQP